MTTAMLVLNAVTLLILLINGWICLKKRSAYPDISVGYHMGKAVRDEASWNRANTVAGWICVAGGLIGFLFTPAALLLLEAERGVVLGSYFFLAAILLLLVFLIPLWTVRKIGNP